MLQTPAFEKLSVNPGNETIAKDVFAFTAIIRPLKFFGVQHRMTVIRLPNSNDLVVYSPFDPDLVDLSSLGTVRAIIAPNELHCSYPQRFLEAHPGASLYSSPALKKKFPEREWGTILDGSKAEDIISPFVLVKTISATPMQEVMVLHVPSGTVLAADLAFNLDDDALDDLPIGGRLFYRYWSSPKPMDIHWGLRGWIKNKCDKVLPQLTPVVEDWEWDRMVPCHGDVMHSGAKAAFRNGTYRFVAETAQALGNQWSGSTKYGVVALGVALAAGTGLLVRRYGGVGG